VFFFAQRYGTDGTHDGMSTFDMMWGAYPDFRKGMYVTSYLWATLFLVESERALHRCTPIRTQPSIPTG
jgi:hypothetical protein